MKMFWLKSVRVQFLGKKICKGIFFILFQGSVFEIQNLGRTPPSISNQVPPRDDTPPEISLFDDSESSMAEGYEAFNNYESRIDHLPTTSRHHLLISFCGFCSNSPVGFNNHLNPDCIIFFLLLVLDFDSTFPRISVCFCDSFMDFTD